MAEEQQQVVQQSPIFAGLEERIGQSIFQGNSEKNLSDRLLGKEDYTTLKNLMLKKEWNREDVSSLMYSLTAIESKLSNLEEWERYVLGKFFAWIREFVSIQEELFNYQEKASNGELKISEIGKRALDSSVKTQLSTVRFSVDAFLFVLRTSLSKDAFAFESLSTNKVDIAYTPQAGINQSEKKPLFSFGR
jgi:hypothetical protein